MATRRRRRSIATSARSAGFSAKKMLTDAKDPLLMIGGFMAANMVGKFLDKTIKKPINGFLGLDGPSGKYTRPVIIAAAGLAASQLVKNRDLKTVCVGVATSGLAQIAEQAIGVKTLSGDENELAIMPGYGATEDYNTPNLPMLIGSDENYELPDIPIEGMGEDYDMTDIPSIGMGEDYNEYEETYDGVDGEHDSIEIE